MKNWETTCRIIKVRQHHPFGCGIACAAMVAGIPYEDVRALFDERGLKAKRQPYSTNFTELRTCLGVLGIESQRKRWSQSGWDALDDIGIVAVDSSASSTANSWHWVVAERHPVYGVVLHDPDFELPAFSLKAPKGVASQPFTQYQALNSWIRISS